MSSFRAQVYAVVDWLAAQPPLDVVRMNQADMPELAADWVRGKLVLVVDPAIAVTRSAP